MSNKKLKALKDKTNGAAVGGVGAVTSPILTATLPDLNLLHELWILYALDIVRDCKGSAQLQARYRTVSSIYI